MRRAERPLLQLPHLLLLGFLLFLTSQLLWHHFTQRSLDASYRPLGKPLRADSYRGIAMGSTDLFGYLLAIRLQLHDNQVGRHFSYRLVDYRTLVEWLDRISDINPDSEYLMMLASRVYSQTREPGRLRLLVEFIERRFDDNPQLHWRRLTEACLIAKHHLDDLPLALSLAQKLAEQPASVVMPHWARDMSFLLLAEMNELESAVAIIQAMLSSAAISDPDELHFLRGKLLDFQQKLSESQQSINN